MRFLEKIFSIKNSLNRKHKIVTVLGIKLKFKNKVKNYDKVILLGENCELGYQYVKNFGNLESSLFNWCLVFDKENFLKAVENPCIVTSKEVENVTHCAMFDDFTSGCRFHSKRTFEELLDKSGQPDLLKYEEEKQDLIARNKHLSQKLIKIYKENCTKLFIYKAQQLNKTNIEGYICFLDNLNKILSANAKNANILFIVTSEFYDVFKDEFKSQKNIYIRKVERFTEIPDSVNEKVTDNYNWNKIFQEFRPLSIKKKQKTYKYEKTKNNTAN